MGGLAIQRFVDELQDVYPKLQASRIQYTDLAEIFPEDPEVPTDDSVIGELHKFLVKRNLIADMAPAFDMGSTRLAAWHAYDGDPRYLQKAELPSDALRAMTNKVDFGDIDIGLRFAEDSVKKLVSELNDTKLGKYHFFARRVMDVHVGVVLDDERMVQLDLNDISSNTRGWKLTHFSSFIDLNERLKGTYQTVMLRVLTHRFPPPGRGLGDKYDAMAHKAVLNGFTYDGKRCSLTPSGFVHEVHEWVKPSTRSKSGVTRRKFKSDEPVFKVGDRQDRLMQELFMEYVKHHLGVEYAQENEEKLMHIGVRELYHLTRFSEFLATHCKELVPHFRKDFEHDVDEYVKRSTPDAAARTAAKLRVKSLLRRINDNSAWNKEV